MTIYDEIKGYLEKYPSARERRNKNKFIGFLLFSKHRLENRQVTKEILTSIVVEVNSYDRAWRQVLEKETHLRGKDYSLKDELEHNKRLDLGYPS